MYIMYLVSNVGCCYCRSLKSSLISYLSLFEIGSLNPNNDEGSSTPVGAIVGGVIGGIAGIALVVFCVGWNQRRKWMQQRTIDMGMLQDTSGRYHQIP
jgi:hypothetical protein